MEILMDIHTREKLFAGRVPTTPGESYKTSLLMLGVSPVTFAKDSRQSSMKLSKSGPKGLTHNSPVTQMLKGRYIRDAHTELTLETVEGLLEDSAIASTATSLTTSSDDDLRSLRLQWTKSHKLTVLQLLETLRDATAAEQYMLRFDYFSLHQRCLAILRKLRDVHAEKFHQYGHGRIEHDFQLALIVPQIFHVASETAKAEEEFKMKNIESRMLRRSSEVVDEFIGREGSVESTKLAKMRAVSLPTTVINKGV
jgi:hypothetical protein